jgi:hypothetical protein
MREPTKATYRSFEANADLEFDHFLAQKLSMTVAEMRRRVSSQEYLEWAVYFARDAQRKELAAKKAG